MEKPTKDDIESPKINKIKLKKVFIQFGIVFIAIGVLYGVGSMFISEPSPEEVEMDTETTGKQFAELILPPIEKTVVDEIPQTVFEMILFIKNNPDFSNEEVDLLLSYAVGKEQVIVDEEVNEKVRELMKEYIEDENN